MPVYLLTETQWRAAYQSAETTYTALKACTQQPLNEAADEVDALLAQWLELMQTLKVEALQDDPAFAGPLLEELASMNTELRDLFIARKEALALALNQQKKATAGVEAYNQRR